ncbi:MAG: membrane or secreted protein [Bacteroidota bacterium]
MRSQLTFIVLLLGTSLSAQKVSKMDMLGGWSTQADDGSTVSVIITDGYFSGTSYTDQQFNFTVGGSWELDGNNVKQVIEFHSAEPDQVGTTVEMPVSMTGKDEMTAGDFVYQRIDDGSPGKLQGAWLITGRMRDGEIRRRTPGVRKTMKILSGSRFQWIAYNTETKQFMGTGGGTYTTQGGKYVENIEFFSRDQTRVGAALDFKFELKDGDWHHSGKSSKGSDIYEIWSLR